MTATKGLEDIVATTSSISSIIDGVLTYRGYHIDDLAEHSTFEEVIHLLWFGTLPNQEKLSQLRTRLEKQMTIPAAVLAHMKLYPPQANMMAVLRTVISTLSFSDKQADDTESDKQADDTEHEANLNKAIRLQAQLPMVVTAFARMRAGQQPIAPQPGRSIAYNFLYMLTGEQPPSLAVSVMDKALILHADHELNASTFAARVTVATLSDIYSGVVSAIGALKGPLHGGANEAVMRMLEEIGDQERVDDYIQNKLHNKEKIMGFGHRVYKNGDPRVKHLRNLSRELGEANHDLNWYEMSTRIEALVGGQKGLKPNVDFYSASVYAMLDIPRDLFTPIFAISRTAGWLAHILEQLNNNRIIRPRATYTGLSNQRYIPIQER